MHGATLAFFTSLLAQACGALVLALLLVGFYRTYRRDYLRQWALSWWARCVYLVGSGASVFLLGAPASSPGRLLLSGLTLSAGYWEVAWLLYGTYEVTSGRTVHRSRQRVVLAALVALALGTVALTLPLRPEARFLGRVGLRALLAAAAFLFAGVAVLRRRGPPALGQRLLGIAFVIYGLRQLEIVVTAFVTYRGTDLPYTAYLGPLDLLLQTLIGLGLVVWLLEEERRRSEQGRRTLEHLAYHDPLTGLPNRNQLLETLGQALAGTSGAGPLAVAYLDLDRFRLINESLGQAAGDHLLTAAALRLRRSLPPRQTVARLIGDELAVLLPGFATAPELQRAVERVLVALRQPFTFESRQIHLTATTGVARCPEDAVEPEALLRKAELAMYRGKEYGRDLYLLYTPSMDRHAVEQLALEAELRRVLAADELGPSRSREVEAQAHGSLELYFQPVLETATRRVTSVEALVRWRHRERGLLMPADFLWLADAAGLSEAVDLWVLRSACEILCRWGEAGVHTRLAVNFSARTFRAAEVVERVRQALAACGLPPAALEIEVTETLAMQDAETTAAVLRDLKALGVGVTIDDFGTGYCSLSYLRSFPFDTLKIDASFVRPLATDPGSAQIVAAVIALAHGLGLAVVAEGVEEQGQWEILRQLGCDRVQGHLFGAAVPASRCWELLRAAVLPLVPA